MPRAYSNPPVCLLRCRKHPLEKSRARLHRLAALSLALASHGLARPCSAQPSAAGPLAEIAVERTRPLGADLFAVDAATNIWHLWQDDKAGHWSGAEQLGGIAKDIAVVARADGHFEVFVVGGDDAVWHNVQQKRGWSGWQSLGGSAKRVAVARSKAGRFALFVIGSDDAVWYAIRNGPRGNFGEWQSLGGGAKKLAAAETEQGDFRAFVIGTDDAIWHRATRDKAWRSLGGVGRDIAATRGTGGKLEVFHVGTDAAIWHARQTARDASFGDWESLGGNAEQCAINTGSAQRATLVTLAAEGRVLAYANLARSKPAAVGGWSGWQQDASMSPVESGFDGKATVEIPDLHVSEARSIDLGLRFDPATSQVTITRFAPLVTKRFHTPLGDSRCTVTQIGGGSGSYDRRTGQIVIPITLKFDQSLDLPAVEEDTVLDLELRTDGEGGAPVDASGHIVLAGSGEFRGKGAINPLKHKRCQMRIEGRVAPLP
jgi:hypothetical protein